jgi:mRNA interferase MazF
MGQLVAGSIVVVPFPFTDLAASKMRPAIVLAVFSRGDVLLCQITSKPYGHPQAIPLASEDFESGGPLPLSSWLLPHRLVTANESIVLRTVGVVAPSKLGEVREAAARAVQGLLSQPT